MSKPAPADPETQAKAEVAMRAIIQTFQGLLKQLSSDGALTVEAYLAAAQANMEHGRTRQPARSPWIFMQGVGWGASVTANLVMALCNTMGYTDAEWAVLCQAWDTHPEPATIGEYKAAVVLAVIRRAVINRDAAIAVEMVQFHCWAAHIEDDLRNGGRDTADHYHSSRSSVPEVWLEKVRMWHVATKLAASRGQQGRVGDFDVMAADLLVDLMSNTRQEVATWARAEPTIPVSVALVLHQKWKDGDEAGAQKIFDDLPDPLPIT